MLTNYALIVDRFFQSEEWEQFQSDLLMTVRVANDFKTETQIAYENLVIDNKAQRDKIRALEQEIVKLNKGKFMRDKLNVWKSLYTRL